MQRILVPMDFHPPSEQALRWALDLAGSLKARVTALHVVPTLPALDPFFTAGLPRPALLKRIETRARARLRRLTKGREVALVVRQGEAAAEILSHAQGERPDLIVTGTHGRGAFGRVLMGSVALHLVRYAPMPVVTVR